MTQDQVQKVIGKTSNASCSLDPQPTWLMKQYLDLQLSAVTDIVNTSLQEGNFPTEAHKAIVTPLLKKSSLDREELKNYRPVSNLNFTAKLIEKCAATQLVDHMDDNGLSDPLQSAYRPKHSTESALIKVTDDIMNRIDSKKVVFMVLLDLSAAFDTVDHLVLLSRLYHRFNICGSVLNWLQSYLKGWTTRVSINGHFSDHISVDFGVPQGSVLGPLLFSAYTTPIGDIIRKHGISYHIYADDCQLYASFNPRNSDDMDNTLEKISRCIGEIRAWMTVNFLKLNDAKTEFFVAGTSYNIKQLSLDKIELTIGSSTIKPSKVIRNLGVYFDNTMTLSSHIDNVRRSVLFHIRNLWRIRKFIDTATCHHAARALVLSRIDYCNALFTCLSAKNTSRLQRLQNSGARVVFAVGRRTEAESLLRTLHWLPVPQRVTFKILLYVYKALNEQAPLYITELFSYYTPARPLRSSTDLSRLVVPKFHSVAGERRFAVAAAKAWNCLPECIRTAQSTNVFKKLLKTHLF